VDGTFGEGFFAAVAGTEGGVWSGPIASAFGQHIVQVLESAPATPPRFETVRAAVEADWRRQAAEELREEQFEALRGRYEIVLPPGFTR
jgi:parvulin-like peptidyl-prolyl isomerase